MLRANTKKVRGRRMGGRRSGGIESGRGGVVSKSHFSKFLLLHPVSPRTALEGEEDKGESDHGSGKREGKKERKGKRERASRRDERDLVEGRPKKCSAVSRSKAGRQERRRGEIDVILRTVIVRFFLPPLPSRRVKVILCTQYLERRSSAEDFDRVLRRGIYSLPRSRRAGGPEEEGGLLQKVEGGRGKGEEEGREKELPLT